MGPLGEIVARRVGGAVAIGDDFVPPTGLDRPCSGTLVAPDLVVTANHCHPNVVLLNYDPGNPAGCSETYDPQNPGACTVIPSPNPGTQVPLDFAYVRLPFEVASEPTPLADYVPRKDDPLVAIGYPHPQPLLGGDSILGVTFAHMNRLSFMEFAPNVLTPYLRASFAARAGFSGGGLLDARGNLVGVMGAFASPVPPWVTPADNTCELGNAALSVTAMANQQPASFGSLTRKLLNARIVATGTSAPLARLHVGCDADRQCDIPRLGAPDAGVLGSGCAVGCKPGAYQSGMTVGFSCDGGPANEFTPPIRPTLLRVETRYVQTLYDDDPASPSSSVDFTCPPNGCGPLSLRGKVPFTKDANGRLPRVTATCTFP
jgi:hypothetical protein